MPWWFVGSLTISFGSVTLTFSGFGFQKWVLVSKGNSGIVDHFKVMEKKKDRSLGQQMFWRD